MMLAILACMLLAGAPEAHATKALRGCHRGSGTRTNNRVGPDPDAPSPAPSPIEEAGAECGDLNGNCCPPADPDAPVTSAGPEYTCNDPDLFCRSTAIGQTSSIPPNTIFERLCLECGKEGNACCPGDSPCEVEGNVCAIFNDEGPSECTTCAQAQFALNYGGPDSNSPLRQQCEAQNAAGGEAEAPVPAPMPSVSQRRGPRTRGGRRNGAQAPAPGPMDEELPMPAPAPILEEQELPTPDPAPVPDEEELPTPEPASVPEEEEVTTPEPAAAPEEEQLNARVPASEPEEEEVATPEPASEPAEAPESTPTPAGGALSTDSTDISVSPDLLTDALTSGDERCWDVDLSSVEVPPNPFYTDETVDGVTMTGDELWAISFYTMLYANCERYARGQYEFISFTEEMMAAFHESIECKTSAHGGFASDPCAGLARSGAEGVGVMSGGAEGAGEAPLINSEIEAHLISQDDNGNGIWDAHELGRKGAEGLVNHGEAMKSDEYTCVYAGISAHHTLPKLDVVIVYGNDCE